MQLAHLCERVPLKRAALLRDLTPEKVSRDYERLPINESIAGG
jgi:hypothetical protein